jgi:hypothetical protein
MIGTTPVKKKVSTRELFEGFPIARSVLYVAGIAFTVFNFGSYLVVGTSPPLFTAWLNLSRPLTDWMAHFFPALDSAMTGLVRANVQYLIPINRNIILIDAALMISFICFFVIGLCLDLFMNRLTVLARVKGLATKFEVGIPNLILRSGFFF